MAYPNYQQQMYYPQYNNYAVPQQANTNNGIIWVQGIAGAKSYLVAPNTTVQLWDSESQTIYLKSADASGMPTIKILDYTIRDNEQSNNAMPKIIDNQYVTQDELIALKDELEQLKHKVFDNDKVEDKLEDKSKVF